MSEDRTQAPSKRRRDLARSRGMVPRSADLTASVGVLSAVLLLGVWGDSLASSLVSLIHCAFESAPQIATHTTTNALRASSLAVLWPLSGILGGILVAMVLAHALQTGGLWAPALLAPDPSRLFGASHPGWTRGAFGLLRSTVLVTASALLLRHHWPALSHLSSLDPQNILTASALLARGFGSTLALTLLALGLLDFLRHYRSLEARLLTTDQEQRDDQKSEDGDPAVKSRRIRLARSWLRNNPSDALKSTSVVLTAPGGLAVAVGGGPPPSKPILVRLVARGPSASALKRASTLASIPLIDSPALARHLSSSPTQSLPPDLAATLTGLWPSENPA